MQLPAARTRAVFLLVLATLVFFAHLPLRVSDYIQDDHLAVEQNPIVARADPVEIFTTSYWAGAEGDDGSLYRPVAILSYAVEQRLTGGPSARVSQAINVVLHLLAALTLAALSRALGMPAGVAGAAALLFAVHPARTEAVASIVGRAEILAASLSWLSIWLYLHTGALPWRSAPAPGLRRAAAWGAGAALFVALGAKETALAVPLLLVTVDILFRPRAGARREWFDRAGALLPAALACLAYLALRVHALETLVSLQAPHEVDNPLVRLDGWERVAGGIGLLPRYLLLLVYPVKLSADYSGGSIPSPPELSLGWPIVGTLSILTATAVVAPTLWRCAIHGCDRVSRGRRFVVFAILLFAGPYLVVGNLFFDIGTIFAERLLYMPAAGFCLLLALGIGAGAAAHVRGGSPAGGMLAVLIVAFLAAAFSVRTWSRCLDWRDDETLFTAAMIEQPRSPRAHFIVGKLRANAGDPDEALRLLERTRQLYPRHVAAWYETGVVLAGQSRFEEAAAAFAEAVRLSPGYAAAHFNLAAALRRSGRIDDAERSLRKALAHDPSRANAWAELGNVYMQTRRFAAAAGAYRRAIRLGRRDLEPRLAVAEGGIAAAAEETP